MTKKRPTAAQLYEKPKPRRIRPAVIFVLLLVAFLLAAHFLNLFMQWTVIRLELAQGPLYKSPEYSFLGFSAFNQKEIAAIRYFKNSSKPIRIFGFFDFFHPAIFAIWNKNEMNFINLGPIVLEVPTGFSRVSFLPGPVFLMEHDNKMTLKLFAASFGGALWHGFLAKKSTAAGPAANKKLAVSFIVNELEKSRYLKIPYLTYFYFPLLMIIFLAVRYGPFMLTAFFYYVEMLFLFDYRKMFVTVPFDWFFKLLDWQIGDGQVELTATVMVVVFLICAAFGLWHWKKNKVSGVENKIVLFFILLPFVLFF